MPRVVVPLVREENRDPVLGERPELLYQPVIQLISPLSGGGIDVSRQWATGARRIGAVLSECNSRF